MRKNENTLVSPDIIQVDISGMYWQMWLLSHSQAVRPPVPGKRKTSHPFLYRTERRTLESTDQSASPPCPVPSQNNSSWKLYQGIWVAGRQSETALPKGQIVPGYLEDAMEWLHWWIRKEQLMSSSLTSVRPLAQSHTTSLSVNWRKMGLMNGLFEGLGIGWMAASRELQSMA